MGQGSATITTKGSTTTITTSGNTLINWSSFNIGAGQTVDFVEPTATSIVWNHISDPNPTQILGQLDANGYVVLQNQSGFYIGGNAVINAAGLIMTTTPTVPLDVFGGGSWDFTAPPPTASIVNYGEINIGQGGSVFLISHDIQNSGTITAPGGNIGLYSGESVLMCSRADGRSFSAEVTLPQGSVNNAGKLIADAGTIALNAQVVNEGGLIQANSVQAHDGVIDIVASDAVNLGSGANISASGDVQGTSTGGQVTIKAGNTYTDTATSVIDVAGGAQGGNGGQVEISAPRIGSIQAQINGGASDGWFGGKLSIDPVNITLSASGSTATSGTVNEGDAPSSLTLNPNTLNSFSQILLQASGTITLATSWTVPDSSTPTTLTLQAGNNIVFNSGDSLTVGKNWTVDLVAGATFATATSVNSTGAGSLTLNGAATIQSQDGDINITTAGGVTVNSGAIRTVGGGNISVDAVDGNVNAGNNNNGYTFRTGGVSSLLGGISTAAGGNVTITASGNVTSYLPTGTGTSPTDAGSGAFGPEPGIVTITAGGSVYGHYVAADSVIDGVDAPSTITSLNGNAGSSSSVSDFLALSLMTGSWVVNAPNGSINLQEVRNPNGTLNATGIGSASANNNVFNYDPNASVTLDAGNAVNLLGLDLPRQTGYLVPCIYPPSLTINAGAGGITLGNNVTLFPSPEGEMNISTTVATETPPATPGSPPPPGSFEGNGYTLAMSDSGATRWIGPGAANATDFATDHASTPVQLDNPNPVVINIAGNLDNVTIISPKATQVTVGDNMDNVSFTGQNLHSGDTTFFKIGGQLFDQSTYAFTSLSTALTLPPTLYPGAPQNYLQLLQNAVIQGSSPSSADAGALFPNLDLFYLPGTQQLGYNGVMSAATEALLTGTLYEKTYTASGNPILNAQGEYVTTPVSFAADSGNTKQLYQAIQTLFAESQNSINPSSAPQGIVLGGPGELDITAQSINLGVATEGISTVGPAINPNLAPLATQGATIKISTTGDLDMFASQISSWYGGAIDITVGGSVDAGLANLPFQQPLAPHGIWTSGDSDISVIAEGDINVSGSRIAAFDGGDIFVESLTGNVNAGTGALNEILVNEVVINPKTGQVTTPQQPIAGSGILATTLPDAPSSLAVGNITVTTPQGNIEAGAGGITQEPENGNHSLTPVVTLTAGTVDPSTGKVIYVGDIDAGDTGVIAINTDASASGKVTGLFISSGNSTIHGETLNVTDLAGGTASLSASGGSITGTVIAGGGISIGSGSFSGVALSQNVSGGGATSALASSATASAGTASAAAAEANSQKSETSDQLTSTETDDDKKRDKAHPMLAKYTGRVTVIIPPKR